MRIAVIGCVELAEATKCTGEPVVAPLAGELTVTPANEAAEKARVATSRRMFFLINFLVPVPEVLGQSRDASTLLPLKNAPSTCGYVALTLLGHCT